MIAKMLFLIAKTVCAYTLQTAGFFRVFKEGHNRVKQRRNVHFEVMEKSVEEEDSCIGHFLNWSIYKDTVKRQNADVLGMLSFMFFHSEFRRNAGNLLHLVPNLVSNFFCMVYYQVKYLTALIKNGRKPRCVPETNNNHP